MKARASIQTKILERVFKNCHLSLEIQAVLAAYMENKDKLNYERKRQCLKKI